MANKMRSHSAPRDVNCEQIKREDYLPKLRRYLHMILVTEYDQLMLNLMYTCKVKRPVEENMLHFVFVVGIHLQ